MFFRSQSIEHKSYRFISLLEGKAIFLLYVLSLFSIGISLWRLDVMFNKNLIYSSHMIWFIANSIVWFCVTNILSRTQSTETVLTIRGVSPLKKGLEFCCALEIKNSIFLLIPSIQFNSITTLLCLMWTDLNWKPVPIRSSVKLFEDFFLSCSLTSKGKAYSRLSARVIPFPDISHWSH